MKLNINRKQTEMFEKDKDSKKYEPCYEDDDLMNFGKFKDEKLEDVPASYLHWWYHNTNRTDRKLENYIKNSIMVLKDENTDLIWNIKL